MKTVVNKTHKPLRLHLPGGKVLHLGPLKSGQIADEAADQPAIRKLVEAGEIEIAGEPGSSQPASEDQSVPRGSAHGHAPTTVVLPKGNR